MDLLDPIWINPLISVTKFFALLFLYLAPIFIATSRHHHNALPIAVVNIVFGWTILGWFIAFIWACTSPPPAQVVIRHGHEDTNDPPDDHRDA